MAACHEERAGVVILRHALLHPPQHLLGQVPQHAARAAAGCRYDGGRARGEGCVSLDTLVSRAVRSCSKLNWGFARFFCAHSPGPGCT